MAITPNAGGDAGKRSHSGIASGTVNGTLALGKGAAVAYTTNHVAMIWHNSCLGIYPREMETQIQ